MSFCPEPQDPLKTTNEKFVMFYRIMRNVNGDFWILFGKPGTDAT
jgi:hypothetical protein